MTQFVFVILCTIFVTSIKAELNCGPGEVVDKCPANCASQFCPKSENEDRECRTPAVCPEPACVCGFNQRRADNNTCIPTRQCPSFTCTRNNEEYVACPPLCPTDDCTQASLSGECPYYGFLLLAVECSPTCRCVKGYWRKNGECVPYTECPNED